jgi:methyl-accepting chemotaxis protein
MGVVSWAASGAHRTKGAVERNGRSPVANTVAIVVVLIVAVAAAVLLILTAVAANGIAHDAHVIAARGGGINASTDAIIQLQRTNEEAAAILAKVRPLPGKLGDVVGLAHDIDARAGSIDATAGTIGSTTQAVDATAGKIAATAGTINGSAGVINDRATAIAGTAKKIDDLSGAIDATAGGINTQAAAILDVAQRVDRDVAAINHNLDTTIGLAQAIKADTGNIVDQARLAQHYAGCIDQKLLGAAGQGVDCSEPVRGAKR